MIPYGRQKISQSDIEAVANCLSSDFITQGPVIQEFEEKVAKYCGSDYAIAVCNGTAALHLAMVSLGIQPGDAVIVPSLTFLASVNCIEYVGARPIFVEVNPNTYAIDLNHLEALAKKEKTVKAIITVDFAGLPSSLQNIKEIADHFNLKVVEDACHAFGADYKDENGWHKTGASTCSDLTVFSFHPVKHITTGEGGMLLTNSKDLYKKITDLRSHGIIRGSSKKRPWYYEMEAIGYNYRISDFQCALGISQLEKIDSWVEKRRTIAKKYDEIFSSSIIKKPVRETLDGRSSFHLYVIQCEKRDELYHELSRQGIGSQVHYIPVHLQPYYQRKYGTKKGDLPVTDSYFERCLSLPCFVDLSLEDCKRIGERVIHFLKS